MVFGNKSNKLYDEGRNALRPYEI